MSNPKISILLPAYKSGNLLNNIFLQGYLKNTKVDCELIIYNNGSDGNLEFLCNFDLLNQIEDIILIGDGKNNLGLNAALNRCAKVATGDYFYLPHTDMYLMPGWDLALLEACKNLPPVSFLLCSRSIEPGYSHIPSQIIKNYGNEWHNFQEDKLLSEYKQYLEKGIVTNARMPFFLHRKLWDKLGGVDEKYFSYCTDDDLIQDCFDKGVRRFLMIYSSLVYHLQGSSNKQQNIDRDSDKPYKYFIKKWKSKYPDIAHPGQYHPKLIPFETRIQ